MPPRSLPKVQTDRSTQRSIEALIAMGCNWIWRPASFVRQHRPQQRSGRRKQLSQHSTIQIPHTCRSSRHRRLLGQPTPRCWTRRGGPQACAWSRSPDTVHDTSRPLCLWPRIHRFICCSESPSLVGVVGVLGALAHGDVVGGGGAPDGLPPALHDRHLLPARQQLPPLQLLDRPAYEFKYM